MHNDLIIVRGGGDIASGTVHRLVRCGFKVLVLEVEQPTVIRRTVSFAQAVFDGETEVEGIRAVRVKSAGDALLEAERKRVPVIIDEPGDSIHVLKPEMVVDAVLAKKNIGTYATMAPIVIGLGPGFTAGEDVHAVIETNRGHNLGRLILKGSAEPNTDNPGEIGGYSVERIIRSPAKGLVKTTASIGDIVEKGQIVAYVGEVPVPAPLDGVLRGLIQNGLTVGDGLKIGDIDPRKHTEYCFSISDKARAIAGGVLEAILYLQHQKLIILTY